MTNFLQLHVLTTYAASNLNRDDTGRPKTLNFGGAERVRVSSQSLKRAFRTSDVFAEAVGGAIATTTGHIGTRTQNLVTRLVEQLTEAGKSREEALTLVSKALAKASKKAGTDHDGENESEVKDKKEKSKKLQIGSLNKDKGRETETNELVHLSPEELLRAYSIGLKLLNNETPDPKELIVLVQKPRAADIALFGRMLADNPDFNVEAAAQVAHAFTTHRVSIEDDFFTAVDDLTRNRGAGFISGQEYGSGVFYLYVCLDASQLVRNLAGDKDLAKKSADGFIEAALTISPKGKQNSFASRAYASYAIAELGTRAPRSLAGAFVRPVGGHPNDGNDYLAASITRLGHLRTNFNDVYDERGLRTAHLNILGETPEEKGSLASIKALAREAIDAVKL